ncbi:MAG: BTAD domain-containing putative transcriptional regulator, partial [Rubrobacteraceae bacterium]
AKAMHVSGGLAWAQGDLDAAGPLLGEAVARLRRHEDYEWQHIWLSSALSMHGLERLGSGETEEALALAEESVEVGWRYGECSELARAMAALGLARMAAGHFDEATAPLEESAAMCRRLGDRWLLSFPLGNLAAMALGDGDLERAHSLVEESIRALRGLGDKWLLSVSLSYLAATLAASGRARRAAALFGASEAMREEVGQEEVYAHYRAVHDRGVEISRNSLGEEEFAVAWAGGRSMDVEAAISFALEEDEYAELSASNLRVFALGGARVEAGGEAVEASDWRYAKVAELFFYLISHPPRTRERIGLDLWPDASPSQLRNGLHNAMYRLRQALGPPNRIHFTSGRYTFDHTTPFTFDVRDFEEKIRRARECAEDDPETAATLLEEGAELYRGDFLEGFSGGEWVLFRQQELREIHIEGMLLLGRLHSERGKNSEAARAYRRAIARDPYSSEAHIGLIRAYSRIGERGRAFRHYKDLEGTFHRDLGAKPPPEVATLIERLRRGEEI